jgi:hypothetical protein
LKAIRKQIPRRHGRRRPHESGSCAAVCQCLPRAIPLSSRSIPGNGIFV